MVEELENRSADCLARAVAINLVIAWRIHLITLLGRDHPELSPNILFCELETKALKAFVARQRYAPPDTPATAELTMVRIGGHISIAAEDRLPEQRSSGVATPRSLNGASDTNSCWSRKREKN